MLKLFLSLLFIVVAAAVLPAAVLADATQPALCRDYTLTDNVSTPEPRSRESIPYGTGLLWKIETAEGTAPSYLFGTMHSQDRKVTLLPPEVRLALVQSQQLVMEVMLDPEGHAAFAEAIYFKDGQDLSTMLNPEIYAKLSALIGDYGIAPENLPRLKPWAAFTLVGRPRPIRANTQEGILMQLTATTNKSTIGLESMQELTAVLDDLRLEDQIIILNDTVCNHTEIIRKTRDLVDLYLARDLAGMVIFNEQPHYDEAVFERFIQKILHDRNNRMLERIEPHLKEGSAFIAIGASHLPDEKGLLKMLEVKGYTISRVY